MITGANLDAISGRAALLAPVLEQDRQLIQIADAALANAAQRSGDHLACRPGCTQCCHGAFAVSPLDALRLRTAMAAMAEANPQLAAAIEDRARNFVASFGAAFPGDLATGILGGSTEAEAAFEEFANDAPCPALNPASGLCDVYAARPMTCRTFGPPVRLESNANDGAEFAVCELCFNNATEEEIAACEMTPPHTEEAQLALELASTGQILSGDTLVAFCLLPGYGCSPASVPEATVS